MVLLGLMLLTIIPNDFDVSIIEFYRHRNKKAGVAQMTIITRRKAAVLAIGAACIAVIPAQHALAANLAGGIASYYDNEFAGRRTANGETYNPSAMTAAHRTAPFGSRIKVTNPANGKEAVVRVNDRGPWARGRVIDVSYAAAAKLGLLKSGTAKVQLESL